jgi:hypothetical protein
MGGFEYWAVTFQCARIALFIRIGGKVMATGTAVNRIGSVGAVILGASIGAAIGFGIGTSFGGGLGGVIGGVVGGIVGGIIGALSWLF